MSAQDKDKPTWPKSISVDKRIVKILSASTYDNFPNALKEMITNAYDADSTEVKIKVDQKNETILIEDDGSGMSDADFTVYLRIAGVKRKKKSNTPSGRAVIGQFGVGFLAVFPFFKNFSIETKEAGYDEILVADIPCHQYFGQNSIDISQIKVQGGVRLDRAKKTLHYTKIKLSGFTELSRAWFNPVRTAKPRQGSIQKESPLEMLRWRLSEDLPLKFEESTLNKVFDKLSPNLPFNVFFNDKPMLRKSYGTDILEIHRGQFHQIGKIKFRYFIATSHEAVNNPIEGRYLKIRNLNVGVGDRTSFGLGTEVGGARSRLHWLTGEVHIVEGMNDLITVARDKFNYDTDYEEFKDFFVKRLSFHSTQLEEEHAISQFVQTTSDSTSIKNIKLLDPKQLSKKIDRLEKGKAEKDYIQKEVNAPTKASARSIPTRAELESFEKKIVIDGRTYHVGLDTWDYRKELHPACKIQGKTLVINQKYPLFKGTKFTDIFIKMHVLLLLSLDNRTISKSAYEKVSHDILKFYKDYF